FDSVGPLTRPCSNAVPLGFQMKPIEVPNRRFEQVPQLVLSGFVILQYWHVDVSFRMFRQPHLADQSAQPNQRLVNRIVAAILLSGKIGSRRIDWPNASPLN